MASLLSVSARWSPTWLNTVSEVRHGCSLFSVLLIGMDVRQPYVDTYSFIQFSTYDGGYLCQSNSWEWEIDIRIERKNYPPLGVISHQNRSVFITVIGGGEGGESTIGGGRGPPRKYINWHLWAVVTARITQTNFLRLRSQRRLGINYAWSLNFPLRIWKKGNNMRKTKVPWSTLGSEPKVLQEHSPRRAGKNGKEDGRGKLDED